MTITYASVFDNIVKDLDGFFIEGYSSNIKTNFNLTGNFVARAKGSGKERELQMPGFNANTEIKDVKTLIMAHLIAGHELAHLINDHNLPENKSDEDSRALEMWADYFGSRIAYTVLIFGKLSGGQLKSYAGPYATADAVPFERWSPLLLEGTRDAIDFFYKIWPRKASRIHPAASFRVHSIVGGVLSFFRKYYGENNEGMVLYAIEYMLLTQSWFKSAYAEIKDDSVDHMQFKHIGTMHERIQAGRSEITTGLKPEFEKIIGTSYDVSPEALKRRANELAKSFEKWKNPLGKDVAAYARSL